MTDKKNISWINLVKVISLFCIYYIHSENRIHVAGELRLFDGFIKPFYVPVFFLITGYLLYRKQTNENLISLSSKEWYNTHGTEYLNNILFKFVIPTILFSFFLFFPKILIRGGHFQFNELIFSVFSGYNLWFTAALSVAELLVFVLLYFRMLSLKVSIFYGISLSYLAILFAQNGVPNEIWKFQSGMIAVLYIATGGLYYKYEEYIYRQSKILLESLFFVLFIVVVIINIKNGEGYNVSFPNFTYYGFIQSVLNSIVLIHYAKKIKSIDWVNRVGRNTIGIYFLSGALPEVIGIIISRFLGVNTFSIFIISVLSFVLAIFINDILVKHMPFVFDMRKIKEKAKMS